MPAPKEEETIKEEMSGQDTQETGGSAPQTGAPETAETPGGESDVKPADDKNESNTEDNTDTSEHKKDSTDADADVGGGRVAPAGQDQENSNSDQSLETSGGDEVNQSYDADQNDSQDQKENMNQNENADQTDTAKPAADEVKSDAASDVSSEPSLLDSNEELNTGQRDHLYEQGTQYERRGRTELALRCYLRCLKGLNQANGFTYLPQCLHRTANLFYQKEEYEKAIQLIQAEKMYYETALVDTTDVQQKIEKKKREKERAEEGDDVVPEEQLDPMADKPEILRANEYEELARLCLDRKQAQLALEYQGKATKLRRQIYGDGHPVTNQSLDFFTVVYGEVGKQQYSDSIKKLDGKPITPEEIEENAKKVEAKKAKKQVQFTESTQTTENTLDEEWISRSLLMIMFFICSLLVAFLGTYLYCRMYEGSRRCVSMHSDIQYYYMRFKYFYYYYLHPQSQSYG